MPNQIVECMSTGRDPTVAEVFEVAERIWIDGSAGRSASAWSRLSLRSGEWVVAMRGAHLALCGQHR